MSTQFDLVDEMQWEDVVECISLEDAGLEESGSAPSFGGLSKVANGIYEYTTWFYDGDESAFSVL